jgi:hypothetical protein
LQPFEGALAIVPYQLIEGVLYKYERLIVLAQTLLQDVRDDVQGCEFLGLSPVFQLVVRVLN